MSFYSLGSGRFTSGQPDAVYVPRIGQAAKPLIVYMSELGSGPTSGPRSAKPTLDRLLREGYPIVQPNVDGVNPATGNARIDDAVAWGHANMACKAGTGFLGISNGAVQGWRWSRTHTSLFNITVLLSVDLLWIRDNNVGGLQATLNAQAGVTGTDPFPAYFDILPYAADYAAAIGAKAQTWVSSNDTLDNPAVGHTQQGFAATIGADFRSLGAVGHLETSWSGIDPEAVVAFANAHAA